VTVFTLNRDFSLRSLIEIPSAQWRERNWHTNAAVEWELQKDGKLRARQVLPKRSDYGNSEDLKLLARDAEEYSYFDLQKQISDLKVRASIRRPSKWTLQTKLAIPLVFFLMVLLATPFAIKRQMSGNYPSASASHGDRLRLLGTYCVLHSLGHGGALPAWPAAWIPNIIFSMIGAYYLPPRSDNWRLCQPNLTRENPIDSAIQRNFFYGMRIHVSLTEAGYKDLQHLFLQQRTFDCK
jgi:lipopolysaccharide export LptBFGC system permease protein LptF